MICLGRVPPSCCAKTVDASFDLGIDASAATVVLQWKTLALQLSYSFVFLPF